jgi:hypothetical protein
MQKIFIKVQVWNCMIIHMLHLFIQFDLSRKKVVIEDLNRYDMKILTFLIMSNEILFI